MSTYLSVRMRIRLAAVCCGILFCIDGARAADEPLTLINPYPVTGAPDIAGTSIMSKALRAMQTYATPSTTDALVQQLRRMLVAGLEVDVQVVRNPRGGGEAAALSMALNAEPALLFAGSGLTANSALAAIGELRPLALVAQVPQVLVSFRNGDVPGVAELLQQAHHRPLQIGTAGERSAGQSLVGQLRQYRLQGLSPVAYNGGNGALRGVLARQVSLALVPLPAALPYASNRKLHIQTLAAASRHALLPTVPTFAEAGFPGATASGWHGVFVSPLLPVATITRWQSVLAAALRREDARQSWAALGYIAEFGDAATLNTVLSEQMREQAPRSRDAAIAGRQCPDSSGGFTALNILSNVRS